MQDTDVAVKNMPILLVWYSSVAVSALISISRQLGCIRAVCVIHLKLDYCNSLYYNLPKSQITRLQQIQNSSFLALQLKLLGLSAIEYKFLSLTVLTSKVLTAISNFQLSSLFNVRYSLFICRYSCSPTNSILSKITDFSFLYASPCLWNKLHLFLNLIIVAVLLFPVHLDSCHFFLFVSPLQSSITPSLVHYWHKTYIYMYLFHISLP